MHNNFKNGDIVKNTRLHDDNIGMLIEPEREFSEYWNIMVLIPTPFLLLSSVSSITFYNKFLTIF